ncbi:hypothetical protein AAF712_005522 [Marasmius tenuissimus]|uniref:F-box domain-containing protein n=1 Tax=Marasmius tenuissimus TaxID=585030 RepID=A0ABR3A2F1_9AGAR
MPTVSPTPNHGPAITRLPHEILSIIFTFAASLSRTNDTFLLKSGAGDNSKPIKYDPQNQVSISHVCHRWRCVALGTPYLWNTLHFETYADVMRGRVFFERLLENTMMDILILTVSEDEYEYAREEGQYLLWREEMDEVFAMLAPKTSCWRSLHLQVRDGTCKAIARKYIGTQNGVVCGPAPNLETWQLYHFEKFETQGELHEATYRQPVTCFADSIPKLKHLSLIGVNLPWSLPEHSPYLQGLHSLELCLHLNNVRPLYEHWKNMLTRSPDLRTLLLHYSGPKVIENSHWPVDAISLSKLEALGLVDLEPDYLEAITDRIEVPNVKKLEIDLRDTEDETVVYDPWLRSISTPGSLKFQSLVSLTITALHCGDPDTSLRMFLGTLPRLRELEMKHGVWLSVWGFFVEDLRWRDGVPIMEVEAASSSSRFLLPDLEVLKVMGMRIAERKANVKLVLRLREREGVEGGGGGRQQTPGPPPVVDEDQFFTIVGTLPVHVKPPKGTIPDLSERNRQTQVLKKLVGLKAEEEEHREEDEIGTNWKVYVDIEDEDADEDDEDDEDILDEDVVDGQLGEAYDDDEPVDYSDDEDEED